MGRVRHQDQKSGSARRALSFDSVVPPLSFSACAESLLPARIFESSLRRCSAVIVCGRRGFGPAVVSVATAETYDKISESPALFARTVQAHPRLFSRRRK